MAGWHNLPAAASCCRPRGPPVPQAAQDYWQPGQIGLRVGLALLAAPRFFAAQVLPNRLLSGLPQGLSMGDVALAVLPKTLHDYFVMFISQRAALR